MKRQVKMGLLLVVLAAVFPWQSTPAQNLAALLKAVEKIETNLAELVRQEAATRDKQVAELKSAIAGLDGSATAGGVTEEQLADVIAELVVMKAEIQAMKNTAHEPVQLASTDPDSYAIVMATEETEPTESSTRSPGK